MRIIYKRSLTFIALLIVVIGLIGIGYLFYDRVLDPKTEVVVNDELSINYLDGSTIISDGKFRFSVTNSGSSDVNYRISITDIRGMDSEVSYLLSSSNANISTTEQHLGEQNILADNVLIQALDTQNFTLTVSNNTNTSFKINVEKIDDVPEYFYMTILNQNEIKEPTTAVGEEISREDEGLIASQDDDGTTYYFRGATSNNYVSFANLMWRIIRINGEGSVRLILNDVADLLVNYNAEAENYEDLEETDIYASLNDYYESYLSNYDSYIANTRFCSESGKTDQTYNAYTRIVTNQIPTFNCLGNRFTSKIGLMTVDEVVFAGGLYEEENTNYYLYNEDIDNLWWTSSLSTNSESAFYPFLVDASGELVDDVDGSLYRNFRPVISLNRTVIVSGTGTINDPYVVS